MATKMLSGVLTTRACPDGKATIDLNTNRIATGPDGQLMAPERLEHTLRRQVGDGVFSKPPCKMMALREIQIEVYHDQRIRDYDKIERQHLRISELSTSSEEHFMVIGWESVGRSKIEEIAYMVIGETE